MSLLAVSVQVYGAPRRVAEIPREAFFPAPQVDSAVVRVDCDAAPRVAPAELDGFFRVVKAGFSQPRKKLRNSLSAGLHSETTRIEAVLSAAKIEPQRRAETLSVDEWARLSRALPAG
jgi:16S rRNA (adenine1518-N6/adenine1519-N6)-dimethyltransferase